MNVLTVEKFKEKVFKKYGDKFIVDYSKFIDRKTIINIICPEHGEFRVTPENFLRRKYGCPKCENISMTTEEFIIKAKEIHGNKYDYSKCIFNGTHKKITLICPKHGEFQIEARVHLNGSGCYKCKNKKMWDTRGRITTQEFIEKSLKIHSGKYDYSKVEYINNRTKVCIICPEHGEFWQSPNMHLNGQGCPKCSKVYKGDTKYFIDNANKVHGDKYDYSKTEYVKMKKEVCIICPEHGEFWQLPYLHLKGCGCSKCKMSHLENEINKILTKMGVNYLYESNINGILKRQNVDFYLPDYSIAIECQGGQHFHGGFNRGNPEKEEKIHQEVLKRDIKKYKICKDNNIKILYYTNINKLPNDVFLDKKYDGIYNKNNFFTSIKDLTFVIMPESAKFDE